MWACRYGINISLSSYLQVSWIRAEYRVLIYRLWQNIVEIRWSIPRVTMKGGRQSEIQHRAGEDHLSPISGNL
jgi:hypothetical protein